MTGFDKSAGMIELARRRLGGDADLQVADLGSALPFPDNTFDDVTASLVLHYLEDWGPALAELRRVLRPGGRLIVSVEHPFAITLMHREAGRKADYFATSNRTEEWTMGGQTARMSFWDRPLHAMTDAFTAAGFRIAVISEPAPAPAARELFPDVIAAKPRFLCFLFFVLQAGEPPRDRARQTRRRRAIVRGTSRGSLPACLGRNRHGRRGCGSPGPSGLCPLRLGNRRPV